MKEKCLHQMDIQLLKVPLIDLQLLTEQLEEKYGIFH